MQDLTYREQLKSELVRRKMVNPRYSLRAFAKSIGLSPAYVSKVLNGQKTLSLEMAMKVCERLQYSEIEAQQFCQLVQVTRARTPELKRALSQEGNHEDNFQAVDLQSLQVIADWYHLALRELTECVGFKPSPEIVAQRLGIDVNVARDAINRMLRLGLLKKTSTSVKKTAAAITATTTQPQRAMRHFHHQMITKAKQSIEEQSMEERDISAITVPISLDKMELARAEIKRFRRRMVRLMDSSRPTEVYQLNVQFFRLTKPNGTDKGNEK